MGRNKLDDGLPDCLSKQLYKTRDTGAPRSINASTSSSKQPKTNHRGGWAEFGLFYWGDEKFAWPFFIQTVGIRIDQNPFKIEKMRFKLQISSAAARCWEA